MIKEKNVTNSLNWLEKTVLKIINAGMTNIVALKAAVQNKKAVKKRNIALAPPMVGKKGKYPLQPSF